MEAQIVATFKLVQHKTKAGAPPAVYGVVWSSFQTDELATYGQNHVNFWRLHRSAETSLQQVRGVRRLSSTRAQT